MKKPSLIIGKKQIILTCMTLMLGISVYVNYSLTKNDVKLTDSKSVSAGVKADKNDKSSSAADKREENSDKQTNAKYGESEFVDNMTSDDFFAQARLEKMTGHDTAVQTLQSIMGGGDITHDEMVTNALEAVEVSKLMESEGTIESLIKAQGIEDCVVYLDGESAKVVVKSPGLEKAQAAAIKDIILGEVSVPAENIRIFEVK